MSISSNYPSVIVTGANGWLGKGLIDYICNSASYDLSNLLSTPNKIKAFVLPDEDTTGLEKISSSVEIVRGDLTNKEDCDKLLHKTEGGLIFHIAGIIHPKRVSDFYNTNLQGTVNLLDSALKHGVKRAVVMSSNSPIGCNRNSSDIFNETSPFNPYMNYGRSKMLMEKYVTSVQSKENIETVIIRAPWFYGPFQPARQTLFFRMIRDGKVPIVGNGSNIRSMSYIDNLAQGLVLAATREIAIGKVYWISDENPYSMNEIIDTIEKILEDDFSIKCKKSRIHLPGFVSTVAEYVDKSIQSVGLYNQKIHVLSEMNKNIACSILLAQKELGFKPNFSLRDGMRSSIKWVLKEYGDL